MNNPIEPIAPSPATTEAEGSNMEAILDAIDEVLEASVEPTCNREDFRRVLAPLLASPPAAQPGPGIIEAQAFHDSFRAAAQEQKADLIAYEITGIDGDKEYSRLDYCGEPLRPGEEVSMELFASPAPVPEGWQMVPKKPTPEMEKAGAEYWNSDIQGKAQAQVHVIYAAMLAAAPVAPRETK